MASFLRFQYTGAVDLVVALADVGKMDFEIEDGGLSLE
jgi:hypothetical protein